MKEPCEESLKLLFVAERQSSKGKNKNFMLGHLALQHLVFSNINCLVVFAYICRRDAQVIKYSSVSGLYISSPHTLIMMLSNDLPNLNSSVQGFLIVFISQAIRGTLNHGPPCDMI